MVQFPTWKAILIIVVSIVGSLFAIPSFLSPKALDELPSWMPRSQVSLGLDLQGGSHILLEVDVAAGIKDRLNVTIPDVRRALRKENIGYTALALRGEALHLHLRDVADREKAIKTLRAIDRTFTVEATPQGEITLGYSPDAMKEIKKNLLDRSLEIVSRRINELGTKEPNIQRQGDDRIIVQLPGVQDPSHVKELLGQTAKLTFRMVNAKMPYVDNPRASIPLGTEILEDKDGKGVYYVVDKQVLLTGENLVDAQTSFDEYGAPQVAFRLDTKGGRKFAEVTTNHVGEPFAIILDKKVLSAPRINGPIPGGSGVITGNFTAQEVHDLALLMRAGALPAPLTVIEERTVGPDLGADSIEAGKIATVASVALVAVFMVILYMFFGLVANVALVLNLILLMGGLAVTGSTLTLPGIAGIALTLGMAVDANVLIFERIKEELRGGKKARAAIDAGYERAMETIVDSNITTLFGAAALYIFGSGPIRGFGVTLALGIVISMFTAISLTRLIVEAWMAWRRPQTLSI
ncbi:MAG: protein translocase subunit SecD [Candidatus Puniceispirillum sp.]|nr:protein translocase subunit SecD [Candidatus Puniceispirillum sp.]